MQHIVCCFRCQQVSAVSLGLTVVFVRYVSQPGDPLFGLKGADAAVTFYTDLLAPVTIVQTGSVVVRCCPPPVSGLLLHERPPLQFCPPRSGGCVSLMCRLTQHLENMRICFELVDLSRCETAQAIGCRLLNNLNRRFVRFELHSLQRRCGGDQKMLKQLVCSGSLALRRYMGQVRMRIVSRQKKNAH